MSLINLEHKVFNRLTVLELAPKPWKDTRAEWLCVCSCGKETRVKGQVLLRGESQSCGCLRKEPHAVLPKRKIKHGHKVGGKASRTYNTWQAMKDRVNNPKVHNYALYGGRGITIDPRWEADFTEFLRDMGERPANMTLDRIDNDGPYNKANCRWSTPSQQQLNNSKKKAN